MSDWTIQSVELMHEDSDSLRNWDGSLRYDKPLAVPMFLGRVIGVMSDGRQFMNLQWITETVVRDKGEEQVKEWLVEQAHPPEEM